MLSHVTRRCFYILATEIILAFHIIGVRFFSLIWITITKVSTGLEIPKTISTHTTEQAAFAIRFASGHADNGRPYLQPEEHTPEHGVRGQPKLDPPGGGAFYVLVIAPR